MFYTIEELVQQADRDYQGNIAELMIATETELSGRDRSEILELMTRNLEVMKDSVQTGLSPEKSPTGLTGGRCQTGCLHQRGRLWLTLLS